jgi:chromosome segregation ATPase
MGEKIKYVFITFFVLLVVLGIGGYGSFYSEVLDQQYQSTTQELNLVTQSSEARSDALKNKTTEVQQFEERSKELSEDYEGVLDLKEALEKDNDKLSDTLQVLSKRKKDLEDEYNGVKLESKRLKQDIATVEDSIEALKAQKKDLESQLG